MALYEDRKWEVQLTYRVDALLEPVFTEDLVKILKERVTAPEELNVNDAFTVEATREDRFGPINVIQVVNMDVRSAAGRLGLKIEPIRALLDVPGALTPPEVVQRPKTPAYGFALRHLRQEWTDLSELAENGTREEIRQVISGLGHFLDLLEKE